MKRLIKWIRLLFVRRKSTPLADHMRRFNAKPPKVTEDR